MAISFKGLQIGGGQNRFLGQFVFDVALVTCVIYNCPFMPFMNGHSLLRLHVVLVAVPFMNGHSLLRLHVVLVAVPFMNGHSLLRLHVVLVVGGSRVISWDGGPNGDQAWAFSSDRPDICRKSWGFHTHLHSMPPLILIILSRLDRGIQSTTEMLPLKMGWGVAHISVPLVQSDSSCWAFTPAKSYTQSAGSCIDKSCCKQIHVL